MKRKIVSFLWIRLGAGHFVPPALQDIMTQYQKSTQDINPQYKNPQYKSPQY